jgi:hypothetical protein
MDLTVIATTLLLSIGLGLAGARAMLWTLLFFMVRLHVRLDDIPAASSGAADAAPIAPASPAALALSARAA